MTKKLKVELKQGAGFTTECRAGKHVLHIDQPAAAGGADTGPTPLEAQLIAMGACLTAIGRIAANQRRLPVRAIEVEVEGDIDTDALLGKPTSARVGFSSIVARVTIDADLSPEEKAALLHDIDARCPISDNLNNPTAVQVVLIA